MKIVALGILIASWMGGLAAMADQPTITIEAGHSGTRISPMLYGIFFEETNNAGDGGLYAELVRNCSFEDSQPPVGSKLLDGKAISPSGFTFDWHDQHSLPGWTLIQEKGVGSLTLDDSQPLNAATPHAACLKIERVEESGRIGLANDGYYGIALAKGEQYDLSFYARAEAAVGLTLTVTLERSSGQVLARATIGKITGDWKRYALTLQSTEDCRDARLVLSAGKPGTFWFDVVSLFPRKTFKGRANGMRPDLAGMLEDLHPAFLRFPGGCFLEGIVLGSAVRWKQTIGDISERPGRWIPAGYRTSEGFGYHEFLQLCEDLHTAPLLVANCGMSCQNISSEAVPLDQMGEWVQDALDAIEYANGPVSSHWGALRAQHGHPKPFGLKYIEIGNENAGRDYEERYPLFYHAIKARYPEMKLISNNARAGAPYDLRDDHYYGSPEWFRANAHLYDAQKRDGTKVYVGEYAATVGVGLGNLKAALAEAAFMIGLERNADLVEMACYAPLFVNVHRRGWNPDLIGFDNTSCYGTPSYYVQQLFAANRGDVALPTRVTCETPPFAPLFPGGGIGLGTSGTTQAEFKDVRVTHGDELLYASDFAHGAEGWQPASSPWSQRGIWTIKDGAYRQMDQSLFDNRTYSYCMKGDPKWTDFTYKVKARKLGGNEGFLIIFRTGNIANQLFVSLGGWGNTAHGIKQRVDWACVDHVLKRVESEPIQTGRWYDIELQVQGNAVTCLLDGQQILHLDDFSKSGLSLPQIEAMATREEKSNRLIVKVVNFAETAQTVRIKLTGVESVTPTGEATVLTAASETEENSLSEPRKVAPVSRPIAGLGKEFTHTFAPRSLTILRFQAQ